MRTAVPLPKSYRLLNHGPTVLVTSAAGRRRNVMAAAWAMPVDFDPPALFSSGDWQFRQGGPRTIHHCKGGVFFATGERMAAARP